MSPESVSATAPLRIDIGGGVTDIPQFAQATGTAIVNIALNLYEDSEKTQPCGASVRVSPSTADQVVYNGMPVEDSALRVGGSFALLGKILTHHTQQMGAKGARLHIDNPLPIGTGLGASSSLNLAVNAALNELLGAHKSDLDLLLEAHRLETVESGITGGFQDFIAARYGGLSYIDFPQLEMSDTHSRQLGKRLPPSFESFLNENTILVVTRQYNVQSSVIVEDEISEFQKDPLRGARLLEVIRAANEQIYDAVYSPNYVSEADRITDIAAHINTSWAAQKSLSPLLRRTPLNNLEERIRPFSFAIRGPGAGGNSLFILARPSGKRQLLDILGGRSHELHVFYANVSLTGLRVKVTPASEKPAEQGLTSLQP